jgi:hypothetical protein
MMLNIKTNASELSPTDLALQETFPCLDFTESILTESLVIFCHNIVKITTGITKLFSFLKINIYFESEQDETNL